MQIVVVVDSTLTPTIHTPGMNMMADTLTITPITRIMNPNLYMATITNLNTIHCSTINIPMVFYQQHRNKGMLHQWPIMINMIQTVLLIIATLCDQIDLVISFFKIIVYFELLLFSVCIFFLQVFS